MKLTDSELRIMNVLWELGEMPASKLYRILEEKVGWNKNTTYTILRKCVEKGFVERIEPKFVCRPLISRKQAQKQGLKDLIGRLFQNSSSELFQTFIREETLTKEDLESMDDLIKKSK